MGESVLERTPPPADERIAYGSAPEQFGDLRMPVGPGPHPAILFIHGGYWRARYDLEHAGNLCAALTTAGIATWNLEYRRVGNPGGGWPGTFQDLVAGAHKLVDLAPSYGIDPGRIVVMGHSAGGHLATWIGGVAKVPIDAEIAGEPLAFRATVSLAGVLDLEEAWRLDLSNGAVRDFLGGTPEDVPARYAAASPARLIPLGSRQVVVHGEDDDIVPLAISTRYAGAAQQAGDPVSLLVIPGADHFDVIDPESAAWPGIESAVLALLNP